MLASPLIHPDILYYLSRAGHGAKVLIADGNYPVATKVKSSVPVVYLNLAPNEVSALTVLKTLCKVINIEKAEVMCPEDNQRPPIFGQFIEVLPASLELSPLDRFEFYDECSSSEDLALTIVTGETQTYANLLLTIGVVTSDS